MVKCPYCGTEVDSPIAEWTVTGRPDKYGKRLRSEIGFFDCPKCHRGFRAVLNQRKV
jgi:uncharacterized protein (UPF0212 family)